MLQAITNPRIIAKQHAQIQEGLLKVSSERIQTILGYPGGSQSETVHYSEEYDFWWSLENVYNSKSGKKHWNAFGVGKPGIGKNTNITVEINYLLDGFSSRLGGALAVDFDGNAFLMHNGEIGGGSTGVGKSLFQNNYREDVWQDVTWNSKRKQYVPVGQIRHERFAQQVAMFVQEVDRIKTLLRNQRSGNTPSQSTQPTSQSSWEHTFNDEFSGEKRYQLPREVTANADHGLVVRALRAQLEALEHQSANTQKIDLYIHKEHPLAIFEVKTKLSTQTVYTAIGQLSLHALSVGRKVNKYFVAPADISPILVTDLKALGINTITFRWEMGTPVFDNLDIIKINA